MSHVDFRSVRSRTLGQVVVEADVNEQPSDLELLRGYACDGTIRLRGIGRAASPVDVGGGATTAGRCSPRR
jgi:hypothetical protein